MNIFWTFSLSAVNFMSVTFSFSPSMLRNAHFRTEDVGVKLPFLSHPSMRWVMCALRGRREAEIISRSPHLTLNYRIICTITHKKLRIPRLFPPPVNMIMHHTKSHNSPPSLLPFCGFVTSPFSRRFKIQECWLIIMEHRPGLGQVRALVWSVILKSADGRSEESNTQEHLERTRHTKL